MEDNRSGTFSEVEADTVENFLRMLKEREDRSAGRAPNSPAGSAVVVSRTLDQRSSRYSFPLVTRYVVATFSYGRDKVVYKRTTSHVVELLDMVKKTEDRQRDTREELKLEIERGMDKLGFRVPIY